MFCKKQGTPAALKEAFRKYGAQAATRLAFEKDGATELMRACRDGSVDTVKRLLRDAESTGERVEVTDLIDGLGVAAAHVQAGCVDALLSHVGPEALDANGARSGQTALHRACEGSPSCDEFSLDAPRAVCECNRPVFRFFASCDVI